MICHRDKTFCASSGRCARTDCHRWLDFAPEYDLPVCLQQFRDTDECPGYSPTIGYMIDEQIQNMVKAHQEVARRRAEGKCLACGEYHQGMSGLQCPKMRIT